MVRRCERNLLSYNIRVRAGHEVRVGEIILSKIVTVRVGGPSFLGSGLVTVSEQFFYCRIFGHGLRPIFLF